MDISITNHHKVYRGEKKNPPRPTEYKLLKHLMENPGRVYSREQLLIPCGVTEFMLNQELLIHT